MSRYIITSTDARGNRFFYAGEGRWSDERPDAVEAKTRRECRELIALKRLNLPDNRTWALALVEED